MQVSNKPRVRHVSVCRVARHFLCAAVNFCRGACRGESRNCLRSYRAVLGGRLHQSASSQPNQQRRRLKVPCSTQRRLARHPCFAVQRRPDRQQAISPCPHHIAARSRASTLETETETSASHFPLQIATAARCVALGRSACDVVAAVHADLIAATRCPVFAEHTSLPADADVHQRVCELPS